MTVTCQKSGVQSILESPATDEMHMEDRRKVRLELSPERIRPVAYTIDPLRKTINRVAQKKQHFFLHRATLSSTR